MLTSQRRTLTMNATLQFLNALTSCREETTTMKGLLQVGRTLLPRLFVILAIAMLAKIALHAPFMLTFWTLTLVMAVGIYEGICLKDGSHILAFVKVTAGIVLLLMLSIFVLQLTYPYRQAHHTLHEYDRTLYEEGLSGFFKK